METKRFPLIGVTLTGSRPGGRPTSLRRQRSRQERRPRRTGRLLRSRLPCAAHNRRPAQNSRAAPAQTAAPNFPACCSAAQRFGRGFQQTPSLYWSGLCHRRVRSPLVSVESGCDYRHARPWDVGLRCANPTYAAISRLCIDHTCPCCNARWFRKAPPEPPSSAAAGGAFRRSCLSPRSGRVLRRPP